MDGQNARHDVHVTQFTGRANILG